MTEHDFKSGEVIWSAAHGDCCLLWRTGAKFEASPRRVTNWHEREFRACLFRPPNGPQWFPTPRAPDRAGRINQTGSDARGCTRPPSGTFGGPGLGEFRVKQKKRTQCNI